MLIASPHSSHSPLSHKFSKCVRVLVFRVPEQNSICEKTQDATPSANFFFFFETCNSCKRVPPNKRIPGFLGLQGCVWTHTRIYVVKPWENTATFPRKTSHQEKGFSPPVRPPLVCKDFALLCAAELQTWAIGKTLTRGVSADWRQDPSFGQVLEVGAQQDVVYLGVALLQNFQHAMNVVVAVGAQL